MSFNEVITFGGGINTDDTPQSVPKGDYRDFSYCRLGYNDGNAYAVETSDGTLIIPEPTIGVGDQIMGATQWVKRNAIVYFVFKASLVHEIWYYDIDNQSHEIVIQSTELNFSREWPIFHANIVDDILKWTDGRWDNQMYEADGTRLFNPPYQINIQKARDNFYTSITLQTIDAVKWPMDPPIVSYFTDTTRNDNKLRNKLFKFIIQPIYENGETGVWSMYSNFDLPQQSEFVSGTNWVFLNNSNGIRIQFNTGSEVIRKFNLAVQQFDRESFGAVPPFGVFLQLDKDQDVIADNTIHFVNFYGDAATSAAVDVFKNYDRLPIVADCQEYLPTNQLTYVNFREGYDKPTEAPFILDVDMDYDTEEIIWNPYIYNLAARVDDVGADYYFYIRNQQLTSVTVTFNANTEFGFIAGVVYSFVETLSNTFLQFTFSEQQIQDAIGQPTTMAANLYALNLMGDSFTDQFGIPNGSAINLGAGGAIRYEAIYPGATGIYNNKLVNQNRQTFATPSLKTGATHSFGIVYGDRAYRDSTVYTVDSMNLFVPWFYDIDKSGFSDPKNPFTITPNITIRHIPPVWATKYWIVAKPATEILSFGHWVTNRDDNSVVGAGFVASIRVDTELAGSANRYVIDLDNYYENENLGAAIKHEIKIGDKVRFIRQNAFSHDYLPYLEVDVLDVQIGAGTNGRNRIYTNIFDLTLIEPDAVGTSGGQVFGQLLEIYTPRPSTDDTGVFISSWKDVTEAIDIRNPHTDDRAHGAPPLFYFYILPDPYRFYIHGDFSYLQGQTYSITVYGYDGSINPISTVITVARYDQDSNITIFLLGFTPNANTAYATVDTRAGVGSTNQYQIVGNLISSLPATFSINYGDVYVRQRNYISGFDGSDFIQFWYIEDPDYSDYWPSKIYNDGRIRIEDPNAKMTHRQATAIHSDSFIVGTQINGLSSFGLDNQNIEDMNPVFGPVVRTYMSGREGKTLKCLQPKKENSIYIQYYPNEVGSDSTVRVSNTTFASWFDYKSLIGCSNAGATAILPNGSIIYFDNNSGSFVYSGANGQITVSEIDQDSGKDYKFRTKTKALAAAYNVSDNPVVRTYVNESVGEVGFAFRFDSPYTGDVQGGFNPAVGQILEVFLIQGNLEFLYGYDIVFYFEGSGNLYNGTINFVEYNALFNFTRIGLEGVTPDVADYLQFGYYYTTSGMSYDHVVFDYVNMRWRSTYDYNFQQFCNLGQTLVGWGIDNQMYLHNQPNEWNFHGDSFVQKVSFVSNENPLALKRYQDITLVSDDLFSIEARSEPNRSYPLGMKTIMPTNLISTYEGYGKVNYRKNLYDAKFFVDSNTITTAYDPPANPVNGWVLPGDQTGLLNNPLATPPIFPDSITIIQDDGNIYTGQVSTAVYAPVPADTTTITLVGAEPGTNGVAGTWYFSERALCNGQDIRANALTHTLEYDPTINNTSSILVSVGIKGVLS
jgi:hypothetical protein